MMDALLETQPANDDAIFDELLRTMSEVLDVRVIFPRVSEVTSRILPHDRLTMTFHDGHGHIVIEAASNDEFPSFSRITVDDSGLHALNQPFLIADDLTQKPLPIREPHDLHDRIVALGYRSLLRVHLRARDELIGLAFWSKRPRAFTVQDVSVARRVADHVALAVSHEQLAESARRGAEARARTERLDARAAVLVEGPDARHGRVLGQSGKWKEILKRALQVSATETTVLLSGESGTGKEVVARFIQRASPRQNRPFIAINCAALPEQLLEAELFGYERGAFTGALHAKPGHIELASGGVLFLDEVTEMTLSAQSKFLRVLQEREFQRLGGTRPLKADIRVIAATNRDLRKVVERGTFREDLYYRLQVFEIRLPPLRDRIADILPLSEAFLEEVGRSLGRPPSGLTREATRAMLAYPWPGNVRELRNALERAAILSDGGLIAAEHLSLPIDGDRTPDRTPELLAAVASSTTDLSVIEHQAIAQVLQQVGGNKSEAARRLGLSRTQLYVRMRKYRLDSASAAS
jgi:two-component system response regulator AtoC